MKKIKVAVIGAGYWGPNLIRNFIKIPRAEVVFACDINKKALLKISSAFPFINITSNYNDILRDKNIDFVAIATPVATHYSLAKKALLAKKHVMIEKPLTKTSNQAEKLISIANEKNRLLMTGHTFVYNEAVKEMRQIIQSGKIGKPYYYDSTRINLGLIQPDTNVIWDLAPHDLSILNYIFQEKPLTMRAFGSLHINKKFEEMAHIIIKYEKNITAHIHVSWLSPMKSRMIMVGGSKKMIAYNELEPIEKIRIYDKSVSVISSDPSSFLSAYRYGNIIIPNLANTEALHNELLHFINCIRYQKKPITDGYEGLKVVRLLEISDKALTTGREIKIKELDNQL